VEICRLIFKFKIKPVVTQVRKSTSSIRNMNAAGRQMPLDIATDLHRCRKFHKQHMNSQPSPQNLESPGRGVDPALQTKVITFSFYGHLTCGWGQQEQRNRKEIKEGRNKDLSCILHKERIIDCVLFRGWTITTNGLG
jgi:hypothetical protein